MTFLSHNSNFYCKKKVRILSHNYPLYSMLEICFHRFHTCKDKYIYIKCTVHPIHILTPFSYLFSLFLIRLLLLILQLFLSFSQALFSLSLILCCSASTKPIQRGIFLHYAVDEMERASTPDYSSNWDWNKLFLNISVILKMPIICYNILYRDIFFNTFELLLLQK